MTDPKHHDTGSAEHTDPVDHETGSAPKQADLDRDRVEPDGRRLTTEFGAPVDDTDNSLRAGERGPTLMEDFHFREKIMRFDHERIPERVVHARGAAAYGYFEAYESLADLTKADFLAEAGRRTPTFVRFSTVAGSRGSPDTVRDVRGFATKFYTQEGNFDIVGNNIPVFFIQDGIKFPDFVHAVKPEPHREIPQASSAHDTFWDFVSLQPESMHMIMWVMSDRALPRSYRMMQGFGVHTFRFVNAEGRSTFVKFHWRPELGTHSLVWDETQKIAGKDPDFNRRDLFEAIDTGHFPTYELCVQLVEEGRENDFDFDLLDPTKIIPEEQVPLQAIGKMVLDRNPENFFAEVEQAAFHTGHLVPGIDVTNDPLLQARMFSYLDTQLTRLGGPNFEQIPVNRPIVPVYNNQRDGFHNHRIEANRATYYPNSLNPGGDPLPDPEGGFVHYPQEVVGPKVRRRSPSFDDHYSQAILFWNSMSDWERQHITDALTFELGHVERMHIRERTIDCLAEINTELATTVAARVGVDPPVAGKPARFHTRTSPALSQADQPASAKTRKVAVLASDGVDAAIQSALGPIRSEGAICEILAPHDGVLVTSDGGEMPVDRNLITMASVLYDAVIIAGGAQSVDTLIENGDAVHYAMEAYKHAKAVGAIGDGIRLLRANLEPLPRLAEGGGGTVAAGGVITTDDCSVESLMDFGTTFAAACACRFFDRAVELVPA
ncbi:MAG: Catalase [Mycobacterium sp.]|nr:Catalase [Mycobacterium sp.]